MLDDLPSFLRKEGITHVVITGDLTTTSSPAEFEKALKFVKELEKHGLKVFCIPGNHDQYTRKAHASQLFYDYFQSGWEPPYNLKEHGIASYRLSNSWILVGLDTAIATSWVESSGFFSEKTEHYLNEFLLQLPNDQNVALFNHFPFFQHEHYRKRLKRGEHLRQLIARFPNIKLYCHGHTHRRCIADLRESHLPIIFDPGSIAQKFASHWHRLDLSPGNLSLKVYSWEEKGWNGICQETYELV